VRGEWRAVCGGNIQRVPKRRGSGEGRRSAHALSGRGRRSTCPAASQPALAVRGAAKLPCKRHTHRHTQRTHARTHAHTHAHTRTHTRHAGQPKDGQPQAAEAAGCLCAQGKCAVARAWCMGVVWLPGPACAQEAWPSPAAAAAAAAAASKWLHARTHTRMQARLRSHAPHPADPCTSSCLSRSILTTTSACTPHTTHARAASTMRPTAAQTLSSSLAKSAVRPAPRVDGPQRGQ